jgi:hypothetical protein
MRKSSLRGLGGARVVASSSFFGSGVVAFGFDLKKFLIVDNLFGLRVCVLLKVGRFW